MYRIIVKTKYENIPTNAIYIHAFTALEYCKALANYGYYSKDELYIRNENNGITIKALS